MMLFVRIPLAPTSVDVNLALKETSVNIIMMSVKVTPVSLGAPVLILWGPTSVNAPPGGQAGTVITTLMNV